MSTVELPITSVAASSSDTASRPRSGTVRLNFSDALPRSASAQIRWSTIASVLPCIEM